MKWRNIIQIRESRKDGGVEEPGETLHFQLLASPNAAHYKTQAKKEIVRSPNRGTNLEW